MHDKGMQLMVKIDTGLFLDVQGLSVFMMFGVIHVGKYIFTCIHECFRLLFDISVSLPVMMTW